MYLWIEERVEVLRVIDGDTIDVRLDLGFEIKKKVRLRLTKVDCPERKDKVGWQKAKDFVTNALSSGKVKIVTYKAGGFGRYLADIWVGKIHLNKELLEKGYAKLYVKRSK